MKDKELAKQSVSELFKLDSRNTYVYHVFREIKARKPLQGIRSYKMQI